MSKKVETEKKNVVVRRNKTGVKIAEHINSQFKDFYGKTSFIDKVINSIGAIMLTHDKTFTREAILQGREEILEAVQKKYPSLIYNSNNQRIWGGVD